VRIDDESAGPALDRSAAGAQLDLEQHGGRSSQDVAVRIARRIPALAAAIWFNNLTAAPAKPNRPWLRTVS